MVKTKGKTVKKKKKGPAIPMPPFEYSPPTILELGAKPSEFVRLKISGPALPHLNFEWPAVPTEVTLGLIKGAITQRHGGGMPSMVLYKDLVDPKHELSEHDDSTMLKDLGVVGVIPGAEGSDSLPTVQLYYDYHAPGAGDPIVCKEPDPVESKHELPVKEYVREKRKLLERR